MLLYPAPKNIRVFQVVELTTKRVGFGLEDVSLILDVTGGYYLYHSAQGHRALEGPLKLVRKEKIYDQISGEYYESIMPARDSDKLDDTGCADNDGMTVSWEVCLERGAHA